MDLPERTPDGYAQVWLDVFPGLPADCMGHGSDAYASKNCQLFDRDITFDIALSTCNHNVASQLRGRMPITLQDRFRLRLRLVTIATRYSLGSILDPLAGACPAFHCHISHVVSVRATEQMIRAHAWWVIAVVADLDVIRQWPPLNLFDKAMGVDCAAPSAGRYAPVARLSASAGPYPTWSEIRPNNWTILVDARPEFVDQVALGALEPFSLNALLAAISRTVGQMPDGALELLLTASTGQGDDGTIFVGHRALQSLVARPRSGYNRAGLRRVNYTTSIRAEAA